MPSSAATTAADARASILAEKLAAMSKSERRRAAHT
jgi:hypothetical protein